MYFLQLSIACNITALFSLHPYISRCTTLSGSHFVYVLCTSCSIGITLTKYKCKFRFCSARPNDIMQHFSDTNQQTTHNSRGITIPIRTLQPNSPFRCHPTLQKTRHFQRTNLNPYLPKMLQSRKLTTKISSQTKFTMSRRHSAHN